MTPVDLRPGEGEEGPGVLLPDDRSKPGSAAHLLDDSKLRFRVSEARRVCSFEKEKKRKTRTAWPTIWIAGPFQMFSMSSLQDGCARFIQRTSDTLSTYKCTLDNREYSFTSIMIEAEKSILQVSCGARWRCTLISASGFGFCRIEWTVLRVLLLLQMTSLTALVFTVAAEERRRRRGHTVERNSKLEQLLACCPLVDVGIMSLIIRMVSRSEAFTDYISASFLLCTPVLVVCFSQVVCAQCGPRYFSHEQS